MKLITITIIIIIFILILLFDAFLIIGGKIGLIEYETILICLPFLTLIIFPTIHYILYYFLDKKKEPDPLKEVLKIMNEIEMKNGINDENTIYTTGNELQCKTDGISCKNCGLRFACVMSESFVSPED